MNIKNFAQFLTQVVAPMFPGALVSKAGKLERKTSSLVVYLPGATALRVKGSPSAAQTYEITRKQAFDESEKRLAKSLVQSYYEVKKHAKEYVDELGDYIVRRAIARSVAPSNQKQQATIAALLEKLTEWSAQTYEGDRVSAGILVGGKTLFA